MINLIALPCLCVDVFDGTDEMRAGGEALNFAVHSSKFEEINVSLLGAVDFIISDAVLGNGNKTSLNRLYNELINKDWFMTFPDFEDYTKTRNKAYADYADKITWAKKMLVNIAKAGFFSSDRTIEQYNRDIWKL